MRFDGEGTNSNSPVRFHANGSPLSSLHKAALSNSTNGTHKVNLASNGTSFTNGSNKARSTYYGHDREEVTRLLLQTLSDLGYNGAAGTLSHESGFELESPSVAAFRNAILEGEWKEAEDLLFGSNQNSQDGGVILNTGGLTLAEDADKDILKFRLRQQKFLEFLELRDTGRALSVLREELQPLHQDIDRVHFLSGLLMCQSVEELRRRADWDGVQGQSRQQLLTEISQSISPSIMIPEHRLAILLQQVKQAQISQCLYHYTEASPSLFSDHHCDRGNFPLRVVQELDMSTGQVWQTKFSNNGAYLATGGNDGIAIVYDVQSWNVIAQLPTKEGITCLAWSPDDTMILTCLMDKAKLWHRDGDLLVTLPSGDHPVTSGVWANDGQTFLTASLSMTQSICQWNLKGEIVHDWHAMARISDIAISPNSRYLVAVDLLHHVHVYDFATRELEYEFNLKVKASSINISQDSTKMLIGLSDGECRLIDIDTRDVIKTYNGGKGGNFVIQTAFGGANESFVISGSEDGHIYLWHKDSGHLVEKLAGHAPVCCNAISWNPANPRMFATGGDDCQVKIWSNSGELTDNSNGDREQSVDTAQSSINAWRMVE